MDLPLAISATAFVAWPLFALACFSLLAPARAVAIALVAGMLFLPVFEFKHPDLPVMDRTIFAIVPVLVLSLFFGFRYFRRFRFSWVDVPLLLFSGAPYFSAWSNGLAPYHRWSALWVEALQFIAPFLLGRVFFRGEKEARHLLEAIVVGALLYVPLCLIETRYGNILHPLVYATEVLDWQPNLRWGAYRPQVFQVNGLITCFWMAAAAVLASSLFRGARAGKWLAASAALFLCVAYHRSAAAFCFALVGLAVVWLPRWRAIASAGSAITYGYLFMRVTGLWSGASFVQWASAVFGPDRAWSLRYRLLNDDLLVRHALSQPLFGWSGWNRGAVYSGSLEQTVTTFDALWSLTLAETGLFGLVTFYTAIALPIWLVVRQGKAKSFSVRALTALSTMMILESAINDWQNPVWLTVTGALCSLVISESVDKLRHRSEPAEALGWRPLRTS